MKILALVSLRPDAPPDQIRSQLTEELKGSWSLYREGTLREAYATDLPTRIVFVMEADSLAVASTRLSELPLVAAGRFDIELIELKPFVNWAALFSR